MPVSGITALHGLRDVGRVQPGQHVLVIGAAGGVGSFAVPAPCRCSAGPSRRTAPWRSAAAKEAAGGDADSKTAVVAALVHCFAYIGFPRAVAAIRAVRVIIGPWTHTDRSGSFPDRGFGPTANAAAIDLFGIQLRWFDRWLCGADNGIDAEPQ